MKQGMFSLSDQKYYHNLPQSIADIDRKSKPSKKLGLFFYSK